MTGKISGNKIERSKLKNRIYFSYTLVGDQDTLNLALDDIGIPIEVTIWCDDEKKDSFIVGASQREIIANEDALRNEISNKGIFTWRDHFSTKKISCSKLDFILTGPVETLKTLGGRKNFTPTIRIVQ